MVLSRVVASSAAAAAAAAFRGVAAETGTGVVGWHRATFAASAVGTHTHRFSRPLSTAAAASSGGSVAEASSNPVGAGGGGESGGGGATPGFTFGSADQAWRYDAALGNQVFRPWCESMLELNRPVPGNHVLDLATGTGVNAFLLAEEIGVGGSNPVGGNTGPGSGGVGSVVGLDSSRGMLEVARAKLVEKKKRDAATTPAPSPLPLPPMRFDFADACHADSPWHETMLGTFDRAYCHQGLQFFADPEEACRRVCKSLKPGGQFTVAVWAHVNRQPLFLAVRRALASIGKPDWAEMAAGQPFSWDPHDSNAKAIDKLERTLIAAGFDAPDAATEYGNVYFENLADAAGVVRAAPFGAELAADEAMWTAYVANVERHLADTAGDEMRFVPRREAGFGLVSPAGEDTVLAIPAVAYFGHATAPWH